MPTITALAPPSGSAGVVRTGTGFGGATTVLFGATATTFTPAPETRIATIAPAGTNGAVSLVYVHRTAIAPPGTVTVQVTVTGAGGAGTGAAYTYN